MEQPDLEIIVSWDPNDYTLERDHGRELQLLDHIIAAKDRATVLDQTRRRLFVPYPVREWQFHKADPDTWLSPLSIERLIILSSYSGLFTSSTRSV